MGKQSTDVIAGVKMLAKLQSRSGGNGKVLIVSR